VGDRGTLIGGKSTSKISDKNYLRTQGPDESQGRLQGKIEGTFNPT